MHIPRIHQHPRLNRSTAPLGRAVSTITREPAVQQTVPLVGAVQLNAPHRRNAPPRVSSSRFEAQRLRLLLPSVSTLFERRGASRCQGLGPEAVPALLRSETSPPRPSPFRRSAPVGAGGPHHRLRRLDGGRPVEEGTILNVSASPRGDSAIERRFLQPARPDAGHSRGLRSPGATSASGEGASASSESFPGYIAGARTFAPHGGSPPWAKIRSRFNTFRASATMPHFVTPPLPSGNFSRAHWASSLSDCQCSQL